MAVRLICATLVVAALFAIGVLMTNGNDDEPNELDTSAIATSTMPAPTSIPMPPPSPSGIPPRPTAEPGREGPETTLFDVTTGRTILLWQPDTRVALPQFTPDGRWLVYGRGADAASSSIYRIELAKLPWSEEKVADGFGPRVSSVGHIAFVESYGMGDKVVVIAADGTRHELGQRGASFTFSWSPDGRWLVFHEPYLGEDRVMAITLLDSLSWETRQVESTYPCSCDSGLVASWSPDSSHFIYRDIEAIPPAGVHKLASTSEEPGVLLPTLGQFWWSDDSRSILSMQAPIADPGSSWSLNEIDVATLEATTLLSGLEGPVGAGSWSPDGQWLAVPAGRAPGKALTTLVRSTADGTEHTVSGAFDSWSPNGRFFLTQSADGCRGTLVHVTATRESVSCLTNEATPLLSASAFSPTGNTLAFTQPRAMVTDPRIARPPITIDLYLLDLDTAQQRQIASDMRGPLSCLVWSAAGRYLVLSVCDGV